MVAEIADGHPSPDLPPVSIRQARGSNRLMVNTQDNDAFML